MSAGNAIRKDIDDLYEFRKSGQSRANFRAKWGGAENGHLLQKAGTDLSRRCPYAGKNTKLMNTGVHGYGKGVMNNQNQR